MDRRELFRAAGHPALSIGGQLPISTGEKLGPYQNVAPLGAGSVGVVYLKTDTNLHRAVAI